MVNHWPYRPETLIHRFEAAAQARWCSGDEPMEIRDKIEATYRLARLNLLARITPASRFQARAREGPS